MKKHLSDQNDHPAHIDRDLLPNGQPCAHGEAHVCAFLERLETLDYENLEGAYAKLARSVDLDSGRYLLGPQAIIESTRTWRSQFERLELQADKVVRSGRRLLAHWSGEGRDNCGRHHLLEGLELLELDDDGLIRRQWAIGRDSLTTGGRCACECAA